MDQGPSLKSIKWFRRHIDDFNTTVEYQLNSLSAYKNNIQKHQRLENIASVRQDTANAERIVRHLKQLLTDIDQLRAQVIDSDLQKFDKLICETRDRAVLAIDNFKHFRQNLHCSTTHQNQTKLYRNELPQNEPIFEYNTIQSETFLSVHEDRWLRDNQLAVAQEIERIENDSKVVNEIFCSLAKIINDQKPVVDQIVEQVDDAEVSVTKAEKELAQAAVKVTGAVYPLLGALIGTCFAGPIGFVAGAKIGIIGAVSGSVLGFSSGHVLKKRQQKFKSELMNDIKSRESKEL